MGNLATKSIPPLLDETQIFASWTIADVKELWKKFQNEVNGYALVEAQFEGIISFKESVAKHVPLEELFDVLDNDNDGRIDGLELLAGIALCCRSTFEEKSRFCFELFDFNLNSSLSKRELVMMMMSCICGLNLLVGGGEEVEPDISVFEQLAIDAITRNDLSNNGQLSYDEFLLWSRSNRELMTGIENLNKISNDAKNDIGAEDSALEESEGELSDHESALLKKEVSIVNSDLKANKLNYSNTNNNSYRYGNNNKTTKDFFGLPIVGDQALAVDPWLGQISEPTNYKPTKKLTSGPDTNLHLVWAFGYRALSCRNNVKYIGENDTESNRIIYYTATLGIIYNLRERTQQFYMGHVDEITAMGIHPNQQIVATGDRKSNIHIWNTKTMASLVILKGIAKNGIKHIVFSPKGDRIATVGLDADHTVAIYDAVSGAIISSAKGIVSPNTVYDAAYSADGKEIVLVGKNQVKFYSGVSTSKRALDSRLGTIGKIGKRQTFFCVTYFKDDTIVGCASGELYRFKEHSCIQVVQAHGINEPVLCLHYNKQYETIISGGKDSIIITWDWSLQAVGKPIDVSEDLDGDGKPDNGSLDSTIISVHQCNDRIVIGTRGSDIFEATLPAVPSESHTMARVAYGHSSGELWGLAAHPLRDEFATCGDDKTLRIWSIRTHEQINIRVMPDTAYAIAYNNMGDVLCIGMNDGSTALIEANNAKLRVYSTWKHSESRITEVKFTPNGSYLATGGSDTNIYIYYSEDKKNYRRQAVCRGHSGTITHFDFSASSNYLKSNATDYNILYWDMKGNQVKNSSSLRDVAWATNTCVLGWAVQGIWQPGMDYSDINACDAIPDIGDLIVGDDEHKVRLFRYPVPTRKKCVHQVYIGHAHHVTCVRFSSSRRYAISIGGLDRTILIWKHEIEEIDSDVDPEDDGYSSSASSGSESGPVSFKTDIADVGTRSTIQEAVNRNLATEELVEIAKSRPNGGDESTAVKQWKSSVVEPSYWKSTNGTTDVDFELKWVHGFRCSDCRSNVLYSAGGCIVYNAASLAVVYNKSTGKQQFLQGVHIDEVVGITAHPAGQIFATGEAGSRPSVVVWDSGTLEVLCKIDGVHERGVPLLAFNSKGNLLATLGLDKNGTLCIHDWLKNAMLLCTPISTARILCLCFMANEPGTSTADAAREIVITGGKNHLKFWWSQGRNVQSQKALWGKEKKGTILCVASANSDICVTGTSDGDLIVWKDFKAVFNARTSYDHANLGPPDETTDHSLLPSGEYPHQKCPIQTIWCIKGEIETKTLITDCMDGYQQSSRYITGDDNGVVAIWRMVETDSGSLRLILMKSLSMTNIVANGNNPSIRSVCELDGKFLIATRGKEMHEVTESSFLVKKKVNDEVNSTTAAPTVVASRANVGHSSGEIWGLAKHPIQPVFITAGDDCTVRCWNLNSNEMISYIHVPEQARAVAVNPIGGLEVAIALNSGVIWIIPTDLFLNPEKKSGYIMDPSLTGKEIIFSPEDPAIQKKTIGSENIHTFQSKIKKTECKILANGPTKWIQTLQYSFDGSYLAAGSHDNCIYIFDCKKTYELRHKLSQHTGAVSHLDFGVMLKSPIVKYKNISVNKKMKTITRTKKIILEKYNDDNIEKRVIVTYEKTIKLEEEYEDMMVSIIPSPIADGVFSFQVGERVEVQKSDNSLKVGYISLDYGDKKTYDVEYESGEIETGVTIDKMHSIGGMLIGVGDPIKTIELESSDKFNEIRSIDLVENRICLASNSIDVGELFFWTLDGKFVKAISSMRDAWWASYTCPLGWSVQGIWAPTEDGTNIHAVARSHTWESVPVLAAVDNFGRVRLFNYPCVMPGASDKCYKGHASNVRNITFSSDDDYCITTGGTDGCIFVWATDIQDEIRERVACQLHSQVPGTDVYFEDVQKEPASVSMDEEEFSISKVILTGGDEFQAVKPWKGAIREPSHWKDSPEVGQLPQASLEMKFVYGYRGWDCRNNLFFTDSSYEVVYHIAGVGIVFDSQKNSQIHSVEHDNDIISIAVHPEGHTVATGEIGKDPKLVLWDSNTGVTIKVIEFHTRGISQLAFSGDGKKIVSIGMDDDRAIAVHVCETGALVGKGKAGRGINVYCMTVGGSSLITGGKRHVKFWELPRSGSAASELSSKSGIYNIKAVQSRIVLAAAYLGPDAVTGMSDGKILLWKDRTNTKFTDGHDGAVTAMCSINESGSGAIDAKESGPRVISGGKDGFVHIWDMQLKKIWSLNMNETTPLSSCPQIQAVATKENRLLIGTKASEIYEVNILSANEVYRLVQGHFHSKCEVWGLSAHPWMQRIVTCGDDMTVRVWDCKALQQLCISEIGMKARSVAYSKDGNQICVGIVDGKIVVLSSDLKTIIATVTVASSWIQVLQYSPDGSTLAVGSHDSIMYLLDTKSYSLRCKCKAHHSYITGIDFSSDSKVIQSVSGDYELLFWNKDGSRILSATDVRDVEWATTTCTLGWSVQGIWPLFSNGTDINAVDRSPDGQYLVSGDDFRRIKLFSYPSPKEKAKFKDYKGHAEHVTNVRFSADGKYVYSVGGLDKAVMQFEVKKEMSSIKKG